MSFTRIEFNDGATTYEIPINPIEVDLQDSDVVRNHETIDGNTIQQRPVFDSRIRTLTWRGLPQKEPYITMVNTLKGYKGIGTISMTLNRINFDSTTSQSIKIINVTTTIRSGSGPASSTYRMSWDEIKVEYVRVRQ